LLVPLRLSMDSGLLPLHLCRCAHRTGGLFQRNRPSEARGIVARPFRQLFRAVSQSIYWRRMLARRRVPEQGIDPKADRHPYRTTGPGKSDRSNQTACPRTMFWHALSVVYPVSLQPVPPELSVQKVWFYIRCFLRRRVIGNRRRRKSFLSASIFSESPDTPWPA